MRPSSFWSPTSAPRRRPAEGGGPQTLTHSDPDKGEPCVQLPPLLHC
uniref:Uncharacterized protein n=1 Tax=Anguilla anguilla TaxID=7936 RepID=A0A0E9QD02_ANGAN